MENQEVTPQEMEGTTPSFEFVSDEQIAAMQEEASDPDYSGSDIQDNQEEATATSEEQFDNTTQQDTSEDVDIEGTVLSYLSERLGREITNFDDLTPQQQERALDERVEAIARFVEETGRDPQDWFRYQQLDASEMDDLTAIKLQMISDYQDLSSEELDILLNSKYKLDTDLHTEDEVKLSQLQLKMDAKAAREKISNIRESYKTPVRTEAETDSSSSPIDDEWISSMT